MTTSRAKYDTDLDDEQWQIIRQHLPPASKRGRPRTVSRREIINAVLYINRAGCAWRLLPHDFPKWRTVYTVFWRWRNDGTWERIHDALRKKVRKAVGKKPTPTAAVIDSQSVKTTDVGGENRGYDAGKKISGRKRHIIVDTLGMILAVAVHGADEQDQHGGLLVMHRLWEKMKGLKVVFADSAYKRNGFPEWIKRTLNCSEDFRGPVLTGKDLRRQLGKSGSLGRKVVQQMGSTAKPGTVIPGRWPCGSLQRLSPVQSQHVA